MRYRSSWLVICLLAVMAADVRAGWLFESREAVTGTLAERHDVPVFRLDADVNAPFRTGLPVPADQDAEKIKQHYIVVDVTWQLVN